MKIRRFAVASLAAAVLLAAPAATLADEVAVPRDNGGAPAGEEPFVYTIVPHDTLWDISKRFLKNPFKWPKIWRLNPYIKNPDLIYPGNVVKILPDGTIEIVGKKEARAAKVEVEKLPVVSLEQGEEKTVVLEPEHEAAAPVAAPVAAPKGPVPFIASHSMQRTGFISKEALALSGAVIEAKEKNHFSARGDKVFVSFKNSGDVKTGDRFTIFRVGPEVVHPVTGEKLGNTIDIRGYATVTSRDGVIEALVDSSYKEIEAGDKLRPYTEPVREVEITEAHAEVRGFIVASLEGRENLAKGDIAYIDRGSKSGLEKGNIMRIFRQDKRVADPLDGKKLIQLPPVELGTLVVVRADENTSSCVVVKSLKAIVKGDEVSTLRQSN